MLGRLWSLAREPVVRSWSKLSAQHWDAAIAGNSCLMETYLRAIDEELAHEMMMEYGHGMLDTKSLYDSIPWPLLCIAPRALEQEHAITEPFDPS
eukprot:4454937-Pyramimonas_sp.AAC.1